MINLATITNAVSRPFFRSVLLAKKFSPDILVGVGVVGVIAAAVLASRATLKLEEITTEHEDEKLAIKNQIIDGELDPELAKKEMATVYGTTVARTVWLYTPAVTVGAVSIVCLLGAHGIMRKRNAALGLAYTALERSYKAYRSRVIEEFGTDRDREFLHGVSTEVVVHEDEKGALVAKHHATVDPNAISIYAKVFDENSPEWLPNAEYNMLTLKAKQTYFNDMLRARGHVFLNEVYDSLGIPRTGTGAICGWVMSKDGDNYVDFGLYNLDKPGAREFVNGYENAVWLDFNVDGVIHSLI